MFSRFCARNDQKVIDGAVDGLATVTAAAGGRVSLLHSGPWCSHRLMVVFASIVFLAFYFFV